MLNIHLVPSFPGLSALESPSPHRAGWAFWDNFFTVIVVKDLQELLCPPPALPVWHQHPSGGQQTPNENFISFLRVRVTNVAANPNSQTKEQELEFTWNVEWIIISLSWDINKYMYGMSVCCIVPPWSSFLSGIINNKSFWGLTAPVIT